MRLLLDTHIFLWSLLEPERLGGRIAAELENPDNELWLSSISVWEILVLAEKGRIQLDQDPPAWIHTALKKVPIREVPVDHEVAIHSRLVDLPHDDPADRFLAATARVRNLTLVTADRRLIGAAGFEVLPNR
ncbi:type II toxin-antitoxin system VapC family toxin [Deferrisoma camini]|uniref:type II toxin-antitoxin system VapC family toxin n=1 Tax=Deferrisoma camini TaxID=1035120 RepID=UPI00046CADF1|nr:type II toxin-antitoxin system VapC family toxin [Deferrisoma camini]